MTRLCTSEVALSENVICRNDTDIYIEVVIALIVNYVLLRIDSQNGIIS